MAEVEKAFETLYSALHAYREAGRDNVRCRHDGSQMLIAYLRGKAVVVLCDNEDGSISFQIRDSDGTVSQLKKIVQSDITGLQSALNALFV